MSNYTPAGTGLPSTPAENKSGRGLRIALAILLGLAFLLAGFFFGHFLPFHNPNAQAKPATPMVTKTVTAKPSPSRTAKPSKDKEEEEEKYEDQKVENFLPPGDTVYMNNFTAPSGNITCSWGKKNLRCMIRDHDSMIDSCLPDQAVEVILPAPRSENQPMTQPRYSCLAKDEYYPQGAVLDYLLSAYDYPFACTSSQAEITCWNVRTSQHMSISRAGISVSN